MRLCVGGFQGTSLVLKPAQEPVKSSEPVTTPAPVNNEDFSVIVDDNSVSPNGAKHPATFEAKTPPALKWKPPLKTHI